MTGRSPLSDAFLRDLVQRAVDETSLRAVESETGISASGIRSLLRSNGRLQQKTREALRRWYYSRATGRPTVPKDHVANAVTVLRLYVRDKSKPPAIRERLLQEVIESLKEEAE